VTGVSTSLTVGIRPGGDNRIPLRMQFGPMQGTGIKDVQVYPAVGAAVFVTNGSISGGTTRTEVITAAAVFTGGDTASVQFPIVRLISAELITGVVTAGEGGDTPFFNIDNPENWINIDDPDSIGWFNLDGGLSGGFALQQPGLTAGNIPAELTVENYTLKVAAPLYGAYLITYETTYEEYRWRHGAPASPKIDFVGMAVATLESGEAATLTLTATDAGGENNATDPDKPGTPEVVVVRESRTELYKVVSEYVADPDGQWEKPPNFPTDGTYPNGDSGPDTDIYMINERVHEIGNVDRFGGVREEIFTVRTLQPYTGDSGYRPLYKLEWQAQPDNTWQRAFERVDVRRLISSLRQRYPGIEVRA